MNEGLIYLMDAGIAIFEIYVIMIFFDGFFERKKIALWKLWVVYFVLAVGVFSFSILLKGNIVLIISMLGVICFINFYSYKSSLINTILFSFFLVAIFVISEIIVGVLMQIFTDTEIVILLKNSSYYLISISIAKFLSFVLIKLIIFLFRIKTDLVSKKYMIFIFCFPFATLWVLILLSKIVYDETNPEIMILTFVSMLFLMIANILIFYVIEKLTETELKRQRFLFLENQLEIQKKHYEELGGSQREVYKLWHDMENRMIALESYLENGDRRLVKKEIESFSKELSERKPPLKTNYLALDAVINSKIKTIESKSCRMIYHIDLPQKLFVNEIDLVILIGNILDNAIEAIEKLEKEDEIIELTIKTKGTGIIVVSKNKTCENIDVQKLGSSKKDQRYHGYGIENIKALAEKYEGEVNLNCVEKKFSIQVFLKNNEKI